jgi:hypothetical protein
MTAVPAEGFEICELDRVRDNRGKELRLRRNQDDKVRNGCQLLQTTLELT